MGGGTPLDGEHAFYRPPSPPLTDISSHRSSLSMDSGCISLSSDPSQYGPVVFPTYPPGFGYPLPHPGCQCYSPHHLPPPDHGHQRSTDSTSLSGVSSSGSCTFPRNIGLKLSNKAASLEQRLFSDESDVENVNRKQHKRPDSAIPSQQPRFMVLSVEKSNSSLDLTCRQSPAPSIASTVSTGAASNQRKLSSQSIRSNAQDSIGGNEPIIGSFPHLDPARCQQLPHGQESIQREFSGMPMYAPQPVSGAACQLYRHSGRSLSRRLNTLPNFKNCGIHGPSRMGRRPRSLYAYPEENTVLVTEDCFAPRRRVTGEIDIASSNMSLNYSSDIPYRRRQTAPLPALPPRPLSVQYQYPSPMHALALQSQECLLTVKDVSQFAAEATPKPTNVSAQNTSYVQTEHCSTEDNGRDIYELNRQTSNADPKQNMPAVNNLQAIDYPTNVLECRKSVVNDGKFRSLQRHRNFENFEQDQPVSGRLNRSLIRTESLLPNWRGDSLNGHNSRTLFDNAGLRRSSGRQARNMNKSKSISDIHHFNTSYITDSSDEEDMPLSNNRYGRCSALDIRCEEQAARRKSNLSLAAGLLRSEAGPEWASSRPDTIGDWHGGYSRPKSSLSQRTLCNDDSFDSEASIAESDRFSNVFHGEQFPAAEDADHPVSGLNSGQSNSVFRANPVYIQPSASPPISKRRSPSMKRHSRGSSAAQSLSRFPTKTKSTLSDTEEKQHSAKLHRLLIGHSRVPQVVNQKVRPHSMAAPGWTTRSTNPLQEPTSLQQQITQQPQMMNPFPSDRSRTSGIPDSARSEPQKRANHTLADLKQSLDPNFNMLSNRANLCRQWSSSSSYYYPNSYFANLSPPCTYYTNGPKVDYILPDSGSDRSKIGSAQINRPSQAVYGALEREESNRLSSGLYLRSNHGSCPSINSLSHSNLRKNNNHYASTLETIYTDELGELTEESLSEAARASDNDIDDEDDEEDGSVGSLSIGSPSTVVRVLRSATTKNKISTTASSSPCIPRRSPASVKRASSSVSGYAGGLTGLSSARRRGIHRRSSSNSNSNRLALAAHKSPIARSASSQSAEASVQLQAR